MPKVSVCIPAFQQVEFLRKTLESVISQKFTDYELIISDDSHNDAVKNLLSEFDFNGKLHYFHNSPALGSPANWNFAIEKAKGEYVKILHHDDFFTSPESLGEFVELLENDPASSFAFSGTEIVLLKLDMRKKHKCSLSQLKKIIARPELLFFRNYIGAPSATIFRNRDRIFFDSQLKWLVDVDWYIRFIKKNPDIKSTTKPLICTIHGAQGQVTQSVIADIEIQVREHIYLFDKVFGKNSDLKKYSLFFQLLFHKYGINTLAELRKSFTVPEKLDSFFNDVFQLKKNAIFFKKIKYWTERNSLDDYLFTLKKFFK